MDQLDRARRDLCRRRFRYFLPHWKFRNRETGEVLSFANLWEGQSLFVDAMEAHDWVFALKAGKLGFTELECAFDAWVALFRQQNARVHVFSKDYRASIELLKYVSFGLLHLPEWMRPSFARGEGQATIQSLHFRVPWGGVDDVRTITSYPATTSVAIDVSATHSHIDELSHMLDGKSVWNSVATTVAPTGSCHVVTRGRGDTVYSYDLWMACKAAPENEWGRHGIPYPFFAPFDKRPDRSAAARDRLAESGTMTSLGLAYYLPETEDDALRGDDESPYIPLDRWDALAETDMPELLPGDRTPAVLAADAGVMSDSFGISLVTRHWDPNRHDEVAIRKTKKWMPTDFPKGEDGQHRIDFEAVERFIRLICEGGCRQGHPRSWKDDLCADCAAGDRSLANYNVVQFTYDPYQLEDMSQRLRRESVVWVDPFEQGSERLVGDALMYRMAIAGTLHHNGDPELREHIGNAKAKIQSDEESKMRMVKKAPHRKIDLAVASAMAVKRCNELNL